ncbi:MAG TPA: hypothetical protein PLX85_00090 [Dehalococcoidia bacterium]|nr:hypothetical protein [Dehalococcoidia bacterium]
MTLDHAIDLAKDAAASRRENVFVVLDGPSFHVGTKATLESLLKDHPVYASVWPDGRVVTVADQRAMRQVAA